MAIPSVVQGTVEFAGKVFEIDSPRGLTWLESVTSFKYLPTGANKPYTVRKEAKKGGDYWYGYRKVAGKLHKKYIGKSSELDTATLEEIAEALNTPQQSRVTQVTEVNNQRVTDAVTQVIDTVTERNTAERVTALELQFQTLQKSLEELRSMLSGKSKGLSNYSELPNPDRVTESQLQNELSNLEYDHALTTPEEALADAAIFGFSPEEALADAHFQINMLQANYDELEDRHEATKREIAELRSQLERERACKKDVEDKCWDKEESLNQTRVELLDREKELAVALAEVLDLKQKSAPGVELPEAADLYNQLKARRKKSSASLADVEKILEIIEEDGNE